MRHAFVCLLVFAAGLSADETFEKKLGNGLEVIVHPMHGAPLVTVMTMYKVGSANEQVGQTGITHLCEHMLFKGSKRFPAGEVNHAAEECGGYINGYTNFDEITFFQVVPKDRLGDFLDRHADAMADATFDPEEFKKEMVVVRSELEGGENNPSELLSRDLFAAAFQVHGLHWPVIGWRADVERITAEQVRAWYKTYFRPNNAVVIVVGDVDAEATFAEVEKRFAGIERGPTPPEPTPEPPQEGERRVSLRIPATAAQIQIGWHNAPTGHPDSFALEVLQNILGEGRGSRLHVALVDSGLATEAGAGNYWSKYPILFIVNATVAPGKDPAEVEVAIDRELERIQKEGPTAEETSRAIRHIARSRAFALDSTEKVASAICDFEAYSSWRHGLGFAEEASRVTPEQVKAVAQKYLVRGNRTVGMLVPVESPEGVDLRGAAGEVVRDPKVASAGAAQARKPRPPTEFTLANGVRVLFWENPSSPTVSLRVRWPGGRAREGDAPGIADLAIEMIHEGTKTHAKEAFSGLLEARGLVLSHDLRTEYAEVSTAGLAEDFEVAASLVAEALREPAFAEEGFAVVRDRVKGTLAQEPENMETTGQRALRHALFPAGHPYWQPTLDAAIASVGTLTMDRVRAFHVTVCRPKGLIVAISGALDAEAAKRVAETSFGAWAAEGDVAPLAWPEASAPAAEPIVVYLPEKSEAYGAVGLPCPIARNAPDFAAFDVMDNILGNGSVWVTRLGKTIRIANGLAYDTYSAVTATNGSGFFWAQFGSNPENVDKAMTLLREEVRKAHDEGFTEEEVAFSKSYKLGAYPRQTETSEDKTTQLCDIGWYGLGLDYVTRRAEEYRAVTKAQVDAAAKKYLDPAKLIEVIAGTYGKK